MDENNITRTAEAVLWPESWLFRHINPKYVLYVISAIVLVGGGYVWGRYVTPPKVVITEKAVIHEVEKQVVVTQTKTEVVYVKQKQTQTHTVTTDTKKPDGTETKTITKDTNTNTEINKNVNASTDTNQTSTATKDLTKTVETKTVYFKPEWMVGVQAGYNLPSLFGHNQYSILGMSGPVFGGYVEKRIVGSLYGGIWANTDADVGIGITFLF